MHAGGRLCTVCLATSIVGLPLPPGPGTDGKTGDSRIYSTASSTCGPLVRKFNESAWAQRLSGKPVTDKVSDHNYDLMYGMFLMPFVRTGRVAATEAAAGAADARPFKLLEIGLGCNMKNYQKYSPQVRAPCCGAK